MEFKGKPHEPSSAAYGHEAGQKAAADLAPLKRRDDAQLEGVQSMEAFWIAKGWYIIGEGGGLRLMPARWHEEPQSKAQAARALARILEKDPRDITARDFISNRLDGLIIKQYKGSVYLAVTEAFPELEIKPWEMASTPKGFYQDIENRIAATRWLAKRVGGDPRDIITEDFRSHRMATLLNKYHAGSAFNALLEAGVVTPADEEHMRSRLHRKPLQQ